MISQKCLIEIKNKKKDSEVSPQKLSIINLHSYPTQPTDVIMWKNLIGIAPVHSYINISRGGTDCCIIFGICGSVVGWFMKRCKVAWISEAWIWVPEGLDYPLFAFFKGTAASLQVKVMVSCSLSMAFCSA